MNPMSICTQTRVHFLVVNVIGQKPRPLISCPCFVVSLVEKLNFVCPYSALTFGPSHETVSLFGCCCGSHPESVGLLESGRAPPCEATTSCFLPSSATTSLCCIFCSGLGPLTTNSVHLGDPILLPIRDLQATSSPPP